MLLHYLYHAFRTKTMTEFYGYGDAFPEDRFRMIAVANVNAQLIVFRKHTEFNLAFRDFSNFFRGMDGVFQGVRQQRTKIGIAE